MYSLADADGRPVLLRRHRPGRLGLLEPGRRGRHHLPASDPGPGRVQSAASWRSRAQAAVVGVRHRLGVDEAAGRLGHHDVVHQHDALAPVVEGAELADDHQRGVGMAEVVVRGVGEPLHLAHHVVAEIPHQTPVQRRQAGQHRRLEARHQGLDGGQDPVVARPEVQAARRLDPPAPRRQRGERSAPHERVAAPALAALDGLEEEPVPLPHHVGEAGDRGQGVGHHLAPDRDDGVLLGQGGELGGVGAEAQRTRDRAASRRHGAGTPGPVPMVR